MAQITATRVVDAAPRFVIPALLDLAIDSQRGRVLAGTRSGPRAYRLDDGVEDLHFESDGRPGADHAFTLCPRASRILAIAGRELIVWETAGGRIVSRATLGAPAWFDGVSRDGTVAVLGLSLDEETARPWGEYVRLGLVDVATGRVLRELSITHPIAQTRGTVFFEDGSFLTADRQGNLVTRSASGETLREAAALVEPQIPDVDGGLAAYGPQGVIEVSLLANDAVLVRMFGRSDIRDRLTGSRLVDLEASMVESLLVIEDGRRILRRSTMGGGAAEAVYDVASGVTTGFAGMGPIEWNLVTERDGTIACADRSGNVLVLRPGVSRTFAQPLDALPTTPESIAISPDGAVAVVGCSDGPLRVIVGAKIARALPSHLGTPGAAAFLDDRRVWTASSDHLRVWTVDGSLEHEALFGGSTFQSPTPSPGGRFLSGSRDSSVTVRDGRDGSIHRETVLTATIHTPGTVLDDGRTFFAATSDGVVRWDLEANVSTASLTHDRFGTAEATWQQFIAAPQPDGGRVLLHAPFSDPVFVWEPDRDTMRPIPGFRRVSLARFFAGRWLLVGTADEDGERYAVDSRVHVVDADSLVRVDVLEGARVAIRALAGNGNHIAAADEARRVCVWRYPQGT